MIWLLTLASSTAQESKSPDTVTESHPSLCELTIHEGVLFKGSSK